MCAVSCCREVGSCFESGNAPNSPLIRPLKEGVLTYRVEVSSVPDKSWFAGLYPEREVDARSGLGLGVRYR